MVDVVLMAFNHVAFICLCCSFRYLQEIGYTDTIIDVRSNRVRSLLGLGDVNDVNEENRNNLAMNGGDGAAATAAANAAAGGGGGGGAATAAGVTTGVATAIRRPQQQQQQGDGQQTVVRRAGGGNTLAEEMVIDTEASVMANFDFLKLEASTSRSLYANKSPCIA